MPKLHALFITNTLLFIMLCATSIAHAEDEIDYRFERLWPKLEQPWYFAWVKGLAVALDGSVYIADSGHHQIKQFSSDGEFIQAIGKKGNENGQFSYPQHITVSSDNHFYVTSDTRIQKFDTKGTFVRSWEITNRQKKGIPEAIAIAPDKTLYVIDSENYQVVQYKADGTYIRAWGTEGSGNGQFDFYSLTNLTIALNGDVYIVDSKNYRIQQFTSKGRFIRSWGENGFHDDRINKPIGIAIAPDGSIYISDMSNGIQKFSPQGDFIQSLDGGGASNAGSIAIAPDEKSIYISKFDWYIGSNIRKLNTQGTLIQEWKSYGHTPNKLDTPMGIALSQDEKSVYVIDTANNRVQQFDTLGTLVRSWGRYGSGEKEFNWPRSIAVSGNNVYVLDTGNDRVQQFTAQGQFIQMWGKSGFGEGEFTDPLDIAIAPDGNSLYITEGDPDDDPLVVRIQQFSTDGIFIRSFGEKGLKEGKFTSIHGITVAPDGSVYVNDVGDGGSRIQQFTAEGRFIQLLEKPYEAPSAITMSSNGELLVSFHDERIYKYNKEEGFVHIFGEAGNSEGQFLHSRGMTVASDGTLYIADTGNNRIQKIVPKTKVQGVSHAYKAIILAGGGKTFSDGRTNHIWKGTERITRKAYKALTNQGFKQQEEIKFLTAGGLNIDVDGNGKTDDYEAATKASLHQAITQWATDAKDVVIFLANHGGPGKFQVNGSEILTADELNQWVTELEQKIPGKVTVVIEACNSAAFFDTLALPNRYLFASAKADQPAVISNEGLNSFSYYLWSEISTGAYLKDAFKDARQGMSATKVASKAQNAQAETDGNRVFNAKDLEAISGYCLGNCNKTAAAAPTIQPLSSDSYTLNGQLAQHFSIDVTHLQRISRAWALIQRPDDISIDPNDPLIFKKIELTCEEVGGKSTCQGHYDQFDTQGEYYVSFYVQDKNEEVSFPETLTVTQTQGKIVNAIHYNEQQETFYVRDVTASGLHFQAVLKKQGAKYVAFALKQVNEVFPETATFSAANASLFFPQVEMSGKYYQLSFDYLGGLDFTVKKKVLK